MTEEATQQAAAIGDLVLQVRALLSSRRPLFDNACVPFTVGRIRENKRIAYKVGDEEVTALRRALAQLEEAIK